MDPRRKIITPKGARYPGSGRVKGTPNKVSVEARVLVAELVRSPTYQERLRRDFTARKVHPTIESMVWAYFQGRPRQDVTVNATVDINARVEQERRAFLALDVRDLEQLAAESQALVDRALALAATAANGHKATDQTAATDLPIVSGELLGNSAGSDNVRSVNHSTKVDNASTNPIDATGNGHTEDV